MTFARRTVLAAALAATSLVAAPAFAQGAYPNKPISIVVSYPPGGDTDAIARLFADRLSQRLKQSVIVENKPGAGGVVGNAFVGRAQPDGYTLLFTPNPFTTAPMVMKLPPASSYDVLNGFEPIIKTAVQPLVLVAHPSTGFKTIGDMVQALKGGKNVSYGSPGAGSPMHVVAGHISTAWVTLGPVTQYFQQGRLVPLSIGDAQRSSLAPQIPTLVEQGYKDVIVGSWNGFFAPKGTPEAVVKLLNEHLNEIIKAPDVVEKLATFGAQPAGGPPSALARTNAQDYEVMGRIIRELGISAE